MAVVWTVACGARAPGVCGDDYEATVADFDCLLALPEVKGVRVLNRCGAQPAAEAILRDGAQGARFPVGTILQVIPTEAMVKRGPGYDPANHDWEYVMLGGNPVGSRITDRGRAEVHNPVGSCLECHAGARDYDFICAGGHGCDALPLPHTALEALQRMDARCLPP
ncbi:MAG: hypothetical protein HY904_08565 [Deltaproteobacteria bacterium]|nr:hypothetical protein [Deltaproteobacteria bacterium]